MTTRETSKMQTGAIILCGGRSSRMGSDKATLPFGPELMLQRVVRLIGEVVDLPRIVIVAASDQQLPPIPVGPILARDHRPDRGPLEGLAAGLDAMSGDVDAVYVTSCDVPLLVPAFVDRMFNLVDGYDAAAPRDGERFYPLSAVYGPSVRQQVEQLLSADQLRLRSLFDKVNTRSVPVDELRSVDPELQSLINLNTPEEYHWALRASGLNRQP